MTEIQTFDLKTGKCRCLHCGYVWVSRKIVDTRVRPVQCPMCRSPRWYRRKKEYI